MLLIFRWLALLWWWRQRTHAGGNSRSSLHDSLILRLWTPVRTQIPAPLPPGFPGRPSVTRPTVSHWKEANPWKVLSGGKDGWYSSKASHSMTHHIVHLGKFSLLRLIPNDYHAGMTEQIVVAQEVWKGQCSVLIILVIFYFSSKNLWYEITFRLTLIT